MRPSSTISSPKQLIPSPLLYSTTSQTHAPFLPSIVDHHSPRFLPRNVGPRSEATAKPPTQRYNAVLPLARYSAPSRHPAPSKYIAHCTQPALETWFPTPQGSWTPCQICSKLSHLALDCYHRMDYAFQERCPPPQLHAMVAHTNNAYEDQE
jgi:hypothetical protein